MAVAQVVVALLRLALGPMPEGMRSLAGQVESGQKAAGKVMLPRTLCCPICGRELGIAPHGRGKVWTSSQIWLVRKLKRWMTHKAIGSYFGVSHLAIERVLKSPRKPRGIPALTTCVEKASLPLQAVATAALGAVARSNPEAPPPVATDHLPEMVQPPIAAGGI